MSLGSLFLFAAAAIGHGYLMLVSLNWWYSRPLPRPLLKTIKLLHALLLLAGPAVVLMIFGLDLGRAWTLSGWRGIAGAYVLLCWAAGFVLFPGFTLWRFWRRSPAALASNHTRTVDIAERLGHRPLGKGKYRHLARLPGNEVFRVDFNEKVLRVPGLPPAWDGLSILHLSDLHFNGTPDRDFFQEAVRLAQDQPADLVAVTGDIVDSHRHHRWIVPVLGRLRWGTAAFAILGNHDSWHAPEQTRKRLRRIGITPLENTWQRIEVRGIPMVVIGNEAPWFPPPELADCPVGIFRLCLSHTPDNIAWARAHGIQLMLAGHNHGGQIRLPLVGSLFVPSRFSRRYDCGCFSEPPTLLHVSRGLAGQHPLRWNCRPEATRIILRPAAN